MLLALLAAAAGYCPLPEQPPISGVDPSIVALVRQGEQEQAQRTPPPPGFDCRVWNSLTPNQKIDVSVAASVSPHPLTQDTETAVVATIKSKLKDPDSAEFRDIKRRSAFDYCGWVNAKNGFGGYAGYSVFFANAKWTVILDPGASDPGFCE